MKLKGATETESTDSMIGLCESLDRQRRDLAETCCSRDLAFLNVPRSHKVVQEVWRRSDAEGRQVDWLDVVQEWDWDLYLV